MLNGAMEIKMKYNVYIKSEYDSKELQLVVHEMEEVERAIEMLETYYDKYSGYSVFYEKQQEPVYFHISELKRKYKSLGQ